MIINFTLFDFLKNNWLYILACLLFVIIILLFFIFISTNVKKEKTFKDSLIASKTINMSIVIDFEEKTVEKYYPYDANHKTEMVSLDEFFVSFDKVNAEKFKTWLDHISRVSSFTSSIHLFSSASIKNISFPKSFTASTKSEDLKSLESSSILSMYPGLSFKYSFIE